MLRSISARLNRQTSFEANPLRDTGSGRYDADHNGGLRNACPSPAARCGGRVAYLAERLNELGVDKPSDTAASILRQFGSIAAFTCSDESEFRRILGQDDVVKIVLATRDLIEAGLREQLDRTILAPDDPALHRYLVRRIGHLRHEVLLAFFCDEAGGFIAEETLASGAHGAVAISARLVVQRAMALDARSFLLVHNHPSGKPVPSAQDERETRAIRALAQELELRLIDHLVVGGNQVRSVFERISRDD